MTATNNCTALFLMSVTYVVANKRRKADPKEVSAEMRQLKSENGERCFMPSEFRLSRLTVVFQERHRKQDLQQILILIHTTQHYWNKQCRSLTTAILKNNSTGIEDLT